MFQLFSYTFFALLFLTDTGKSYFDHSNLPMLCDVHVHQLDNFHFVSSFTCFVLAIRSLDLIQLHVKPDRMRW